MFKSFEPNKIFVITSKAPKYVLCLFIVVLTIGLMEALVLSPEDYKQSDAARIMYVHVPAAWISLGIFSSLALLSVGIFILWSVFGKIPAIGLTHIIFGGIFSGFLTMFFGASGAIVAGMVKTMKLNPINHFLNLSYLFLNWHQIFVNLNVRLLGKAWMNLVQAHLIDIFPYMFVAPIAFLFLFRHHGIV